jgi:hypothetical protein
MQLQKNKKTHAFLVCISYLSRLATSKLKHIPVQRVVITAIIAVVGFLFHPHQVEVFL